MSTVQQLTDRKLVKPPNFLPGNVHYETIMGSVAYGVSSDTSDMDIYGFCIPEKDMIFPHLRGEVLGFGRQVQRFEQWQEHHVQDRDALGGKGRTYDLTIYSIVKYFQLCMENNPNMIDSLWTPQSCVLHCTSIGALVRENRRLFLHKGAWHKFKGYAYSQVHRMNSKQPPEGKRRELVEEFGYDCYDEAETEFLTQRGWLRFDDVAQDDMLATVEPETGRIVLSCYTHRWDKDYTGKMYVVEPYLSRCVVTEGHNMLVSPMYRNIANNYSTRYIAERACWQVVPLSQLVQSRRGSRSNRAFYHIRRQGYSDAQDFPVEDAYLRLAGSYVSEGSTQFRNGQVKSIRFTQTEQGKPGFNRAADALMDKFAIQRYVYAKETIWSLHGETARRLHDDFGHGSASKHLPAWAFRLSPRQAELFWLSLCLGDGTKARNGDVYYTISRALADGLQAMMTLCGFSVVRRGPYYGETTYGSALMYQLFRSSTATQEHYLNFGRIHNKNTPSSQDRQGWPIKEHDVESRRVVCFTVPQSTLITRSQGKVAIQGNCKYAYHVVRLLDEVEQILTEGDIDLQRNREQLKSIRRGEWAQADILAHFERKEKDLEALYTSSKLPHSPDEGRIKQLLLDCLEMHYGSLTQCIMNVDAASQALKDIGAIIDRVNRQGA